MGLSRWAEIVCSGDRPGVPKVVFAVAAGRFAEIVLVRGCSRGAEVVLAVLGGGPVLIWLCKVQLDPPLVVALSPCHRRRATAPAGFERSERPPGRKEEDARRCEST